MTVGFRSALQGEARHLAVIGLYSPTVDTPLEITATKMEDGFKHVV